MKIKEINIFTENIYPDWEVDELKVISVGRKIVKYFLKHLLEHHGMKQLCQFLPHFPFEPKH